MAATQDYLSWNNAKQNAINDLIRQGVQPITMDGGLEYSLWNFYEQHLEHPELYVAKDYDPGWIRKFTPIIDTRYVVSFSELPNYKVIKEFEYFSYLTLNKEKVLVLKRNDLS